MLPPTPSLVQAPRSSAPPLFQPQSTAVCSGIRPAPGSSSPPPLQPPRTPATPLDEIRHARPGGHHAPVLLRLSEELYLALHVLVEAQDGGDVPAAVAVVRGRPHRDEALVREHVLEPLLYELVRTAYKLEPVDLIELRSDLGPEQPARPAGGDGPRLDVLRVAPHEVAEGPLVWDLLKSLDRADLVECAQVRREAPVHAEYPPVNDGR
mmetsp:Transcript_36841/g.115857  ORF Transcript_36841/g.115857 Transcript_36841/m.115857 type:complete len:209 (-) Transcript_36841:585-1211(-)